MKTTVLTSLLAFLCIFSVESSTPKDLANVELSFINEVNSILSSTVDFKNPTNSKSPSTRQPNALHSLTLSSRPDYGISIQGEEIFAVSQGANLNIQTLLNELSQGNRTVLGEDVVVENHVIASLALPTTLTFKSKRDIVFQYQVQFKSTSEPLHLVLWSDADGDENGGVLFDLDTEIDTHGGHLWVGGGSQSSTWKDLVVGNSYAVGLAARASFSQYPFSGINLVGKSIHTGAGEIYLYGKSTQVHFRDGIGVRVKDMNLTANGIYIHGIGSTNGNTPDNTNRGNWGVGLENTITTSTGDIYVYGQGGGQHAGDNGGLNYGIRLNNNSSIIAQGDARIDFLGIGGGNPAIVGNRDNDGLRLEGGVMRVDKGVLKLVGVPGLNNFSADIDQNGGIIESRNSNGDISTGTIELVSDRLEIASSAKYRSKGELHIYSRTNSFPISIAKKLGHLDLESAYFDVNFENGFSKIKIGSPEQSGNILVNMSSFRHSMELQTSGNLNFETDVTTTNQSSFTIINDHLNFSKPTLFSIEGTFEYKPFSYQLEEAIAFPIPNFRLESKKVVLGKEACEVNIHLTEALETDRTMEIFGNKIQVDKSLKAIGEANLVFHGQTVLQPRVELSSENNIIHYGDITFKSDETGDAVLGEVKGAFVSHDGEAIVEKHHLAKRAFRLMTSAVTSSQTILESIQNNKHNELGIGTHITGGVNGENGFDPTTSGNPSMFAFHSKEAWVSVPNTDQTHLEAGVPYRLMVRGDRTIDLDAKNPEATPTTLVVKGDLVSGNFAFHPQTFMATEKSYSLVGNPYQSRINMKELLSNSAFVNPNHYYVWDPMLNTNGGYATVDLEDGSNMQGSSSADVFIEPGEAFFVEAVNKTPVLNFSEEIKRSLNAVDQLLLEDRELASSQLKLQLLNADETIIDGIKFKFDNNGNNAIDQKDAAKMENEDENLAVNNGNQLLSIEARMMPVKGERLVLQTTNWRASSYSFKASIANLDETDIILYDRYLEDKILLSDGDVYSFSVDPSINASVDPNRFEIVFSTENLSNIAFDKASLRLFPNPVRDQLQISTPWVGESLQLEVYSLLGKQVLNTNVMSDAIALETSSLPQGVYVVKLHKDKKVFTTKMVKQ